MYPTLLKVKKLYSFLDTYLIAISLVIWVLEIGFFSCWLGIKQGPDSFFFLTFAEKNHFGDPYVDQHYVWYQSYSFLLSLLLKLGTGLSGIVVFQVIVASSSLYALYDLTKQVSPFSLAPKLALFLYVLWARSHSWAFYIYTDSLFTSCSIWCLWFLCTFPSFRSTLLLLPFLIFTCLLRPAGVVLFPLYAFLLCVPLKKTRWTYYLALGGGCILFFLLLAHILPTFELLASYRKGEIIYCYPPWHVPVPTSLSSSPILETSLKNMGQFIFQYPWFFLKLLAAKAVVFIVHAKPFYAGYHNLFIFCFLSSLYYFFGTGLPYWTNKRSKLILLYWIVGHLLLVSFTAEDWDGRFFLPVIPIVIVGASIGITSHAQKTQTCFTS